MVHEISKSYYRGKSYRNHKMDRLQYLIEKKPEVLLGREVTFESFFNTYERGVVVSNDANWIFIDINGDGKTKRENTCDIRGIHTIGNNNEIENSLKHRSHTEAIRQTRARIEKAKDSIDQDMEFCRKHYGRK